MSRSNRAGIANETIEIVERGWYEVDGFDRVEIRRKVDDCLEATVLIGPGDHDRTSDCDVVSHGPTELDVRNETTLTAANRLRFRA